VSDLLKDFLKRLGPAGGPLATFVVFVTIMYPLGLINAPATAHDIEVIGTRVESVETRTDHLEEIEDHVRDDLEKIRTGQAVQSERIENNGQRIQSNGEQIKTNGRKLDRIIELLSRR